MKEVISQEVIENFLNGGDPEEFIVGVEYDYPTNTIYKIIQDPEKGKIIKSDSFTPFMWVGDLTDLNFYNNSKAMQKRRMGEFGIIIEKLETHGDERLESGMKFLVKSIKSYTDLISFFRMGGLNPWDEKVRHNFTVLSPVEQYLVQTKKRLFKGIDEYSGVNRFVFDIETTGLDPETCIIILIGVKDNRGLNVTIPAFGEDGEKKCIERFFQYIRDLKPTIIAGYNSAFFDWPFILKRAEILGVDVDGILNGIHRISVGGSSTKKAQILASGVAVPWAYEAQQLLQDDWNVSADIWSVTSWSELRRNALACDEQKFLYPSEAAPLPYLTNKLAGSPGPFIAVSDYMHQVPDQIRKWIPGEYATLGADGFGFSDTRAAARRHFKIDGPSIAVRILEQLVEKDKIDRSVPQQAIDKYRLHDVNAGTSGSAGGDA